MTKEELFKGLGTSILSDEQLIVFNFLNQFDLKEKFIIDTVNKEDYTIYFDIESLESEKFKKIIYEEYVRQDGISIPECYLKYFDFDEYIKDLEFYFYENTAIQIIKGGARLDHEKEVEEKDETLKEVKELKKIVLSLKENLNVFSENTEDKFKNLTIEVNDCYSDLKKEIKEYISDETSNLEYKFDKYAETMEYVMFNGYAIRIIED